MTEKARLEERKKALNEEFDKLKVELAQLNEQGKTLNQRMSEIRTRQIQLQGSYAEVELLLADEKKK
jgi:phage shock protein A